MRTGTLLVRSAAIAGIVLAIGVIFYLFLPRQAFLHIERGGTYIEGLVGNPHSINPLFSIYNEVDHDICSLVFEGLTHLDEQGAVQPKLAESWNVAPDGLTYRFRLRQNVFWHDGAPFTADDVLYTVSVLADPDFQLLDSSGEFALWQSVRASKLSDYEVELVLSQPYAPFLAHTTIGILPAHLLSKIETNKLPEAQFNGRPVGTGPFRVESISASQISLVPHQEYHDQRPMLEKIVLRFYSDEESLFTAYERGEILGMSRVAPALLRRVTSDRRLNLYSARLPTYSLLLFNLQDKELPFFTQLEVRKALIWGLDRQGIVDRILGGQGIIAHSPIVSGTWAYKSDVFRYSYAPAQARELLTKAGWRDIDGDGIRERDGRRLEFTLLVSNNPTWIEIAHEISRQWADIGVRAIPEVETFPTVVGEFLYPRRFQAVLVTLQYAGDPDPFPMWHSSQIGPEGQNWAGFVDRRADELLEGAHLTPDIARRISLYHAFQVLFAEQVPAIPLYHPIYHFAIDARVQGVEATPLNCSADRYRSIANWYIENRRLALPGW